MKRLLILVSVVIIICFVANVLSAQSNDNVTILQERNNNTQCSLMFGKVIEGSDKNLEHFKDNVEYFLETGFFWEACLMKQLQKGQDVTLNYIGNILGSQPSKTELKNLIKSAKEFKEELEDYIEEQEPKSSPLHWGKRYIVLQVSPQIMLDKTMRKMINRGNKQFDSSSKIAKIFINIMTVQNKRDIGTVKVEVSN